MAWSGEPIVYLPAVAWSYRFQRPQQLARALVRQGHPVLYLDAFARQRLAPERRLVPVGTGVGLLSVRVAGRPDPYRQPLTRRDAVVLARTICGGLRSRPRFILAQLPFWGALARELAHQLGVPLVYDCLDLHRGFEGVPRSIEEVEDELLRSADLVLASSADLQARCQAAGASGVQLLPNAVALEDFPFIERRESASPVLGYVGALGAWFDAEAIGVAAGARPEWRIRLAGRVEDERVRKLATLPNVDLVGELPYSAVPEFLASLDVALVPFRDLPLTRAVDPVKVYEYLASGLPVVASSLPELARWDEPLVYFASTPAALCEQVECALGTDSERRRRLRRSAIENETWDSRGRRLLAAIRAIEEQSITFDREP